ncbi:MAG: hypothetical protein SFV22_10380 [Saprospiraceae bacterium]|nr:hypothetical protein [Saprospiraceae bacterium]
MDFKKFLPHLLAVAVLFAVSVAFFAPNFFGGKVLPQPDNDKARGMQTEIQDYIKKEGKAPLWTNSAFGGMPGYQIYSPIEGNLAKPLTKAAFLWTGTTGVWAQVLAAMFFMYLLVVSIGADWRVALLGAMAYGISTYHVDILEAGHSTKMAALAFAPGLLAAVVMLYNGRLLSGGGLLALFTSMQIYVNHVQITYYTLILAAIYIVIQLIESVRNKALVRWAKPTGIFILALVLGFAGNLSKLWPTYEYGQETIRGKSELAANADKGDGLSKDYLFGWSYGIGESMTLFVPHFAGGGTNESFDDSKLLKATTRQLPPNTTKAQMKSQIAPLFYTGDQPFVGTAIYYGAIVCFLFFLGAYIVPGAVKWWLLIGGIFMITLAWGKHFFLNHLLYDYLPMFNKFRAVSMALGPGQLCVAALAALGVQKFMDGDIAAEKKSRALWFAIGASGVLALLAMAIAKPDGPHDDALAQNAQLLKLLKEDRGDMLRGDLIRSLGFVFAAAVLLYLYLRGAIKGAMTVGLVAALSLADVWLVCGRTLTSSSYEPKQAATAPPKPEAFDLRIKSDVDPHYRVLDLLRGGLTGNATTSYFHKSLSGYHAAKLQRYQEVIEKYLGANDIGQHLNIAGMLNAKYIINNDQNVLNNSFACGNVWFVKNYKVVPDGDAELAALDKLRPLDTAIVQADHAKALEGLQIVPDSGVNYIRLTKYHPDKMEYEYSANTEQLAVFSEIYYPPSKGWKCYLNGQPAPDFIKANYLLRAMRLPPGQKQKIEMRFEPRSFYLGEKVAYVASGITLLLCLAALYFWYRGGARMNDVARLSDMTPASERPKTNAEKPGGKKK